MLSNNKSLMKIDVHMRLSVSTGMEHIVSYAVVSFDRYGTIQFHMSSSVSACACRYIASNNEFDKIDNNFYIIS